MFFEGGVKREDRTLSFYSFRAIVALLGSLYFNVWESLCLKCMNMLDIFFTSLEDIKRMWNESDSSFFLFLVSIERRSSRLEVLLRMISKTHTNVRYDKQVLVSVHWPPVLFSEPGSWKSWRKWRRTVSCPISRECTWCYSVHSVLETETDLTKKGIECSIFLHEWLMIRICVYV